MNDEDYANICFAVEVEPAPHALQLDNLITPSRQENKFATEIIRHFFPMIS